MDTIPKINASNFVENLKNSKRPYHDRYFAMFSSYLGGIVTDPSLMLVAADEHLVHRGDGVFESMKCVDGGIYNLDGHMQRLTASAEKIECCIPGDIENLVDIMRQVVIAGGKKDCSIKVIVSRGPGGFTANPYESAGPQTYVIAYQAPSPFMEKRPGGAMAEISSIPIKSGQFAVFKSCNYLPNALMKKEAADMQVDFVFTVDSRGFLGEGSTESVGIVSDDGRLLFPKLEKVLRGTTAERLIKLAGKLVEQGLIKSAGKADIPLDQIRNAREIIAAGTSIDVVSVTQFEKKQVGQGKPGPVSLELSRFLKNDMRENEAMRTSVF